MRMLAEGLSCLESQHAAERNGNDLSAFFKHRHFGSEIASGPSAGFEVQAWSGIGLVSDDKFFNGKRARFNGVPLIIAEEDLLNLFDLDHGKIIWTFRSKASIVEDEFSMRFDA